MISARKATGRDAALMRPYKTFGDHLWRGRRVFVVMKLGLRRALDTALWLVRMG